MKGSVFGTSLIIAGTAIGAGMLGIPLIAGELGFVLAAFFLIVCWGVSLLSAFLILHVNMAYNERSNLSTMARKTIGHFGNIITWSTYLLFLYSAIAAYMTGGASLLGRTLSYFFQIEIPQIASTLLFTVVLGMFVYFGTRSVDYANRVLMTLKVAAFVLMVVLLLPHISLDALTPDPSRSSGWMIALPVLISAFGYQIVIPNIRDYLCSNVRKIKRAIWIGGTIPLVVYLLWIAIVFGLLPGLTPHDNLSKVVSLLQDQVSISYLGGVVNFFADIAVTTSFLGVSMSLFHFIRDGCHLNQNRFGEKELAILMTFLPPFCFAWIYPKGFIMALDYAGLFIAILLMIVPVWMGFQIKRKKIKSAYAFNLHWTGRLLILGLGALTIGAQIFSHWRG